MIEGGWVRIKVKSCLEKNGLNWAIEGAETNFGVGSFIWGFY